MMCFSVTCDVPKGPWSSVALQTPSVNGPKLTGILVNCCLLLFPLRAVNSNHHISLPVHSLPRVCWPKKTRKKWSFSRLANWKIPTQKSTCYSPTTPEIQVISLPRTATSCFSFVLWVHETLGTLASSELRHSHNLRPYPKCNWAARTSLKSLCTHTCIDEFILLLYWGANQRKREGYLCDCGCGSVGVRLYWKEPTILVNTYGNWIDLTVPVN